jgi:hypothetical protein
VELGLNLAAADNAGELTHRMHTRAPLSFFLKGILALGILFLVTLLMAPRPEVTALRAMIAVGLAIIVGKIVLRHYDIDWPPRRH